ncbi:MAG: GNAT family N-acyltransferase [Bacteroidota bacterium]
MSALPKTRIPLDAVYPRFTTYLPPGVIRDGKYELRFASTREELDAIERLRFEVFNLELEEGLASSYDTGKDEDLFDQVCHHMMIYKASAGVVGTYRFQTAEMARESGLGFYSASEFDLSTLPEEVVAQGVELGRACIAKEHRSLKVLYLLWKGIGMYLMHNQRRYLFGCTSLTSQDPAEGHGVYELLHKQGHVHPGIEVKPQPDFICETNPKKAHSKPRVPRLMRAYLSLGAKVCSPPARDQMFKTIDYFTLFDTSRLTDQAKSYFMLK